MLKQLKKPGKKIVSMVGAVLLIVAACAAFTGCRGGADADNKVQDLDFTVVGENEIPAQLGELIAQKRERPFKLTYADGSDMYIVIGEGPQKGGGFSIAVREFYLTDNSIVIKTELMGPESSEASGTDLSYPVLVIKTQAMEEPVVFK